MTKYKIQHKMPQRKLKKKPLCCQSNEHSLYIKHRSILQNCD